MKRKAKIPLTVIRTGTGDTGKTYFNDKTVWKCNRYIDFLAYIEYLNVSIGALHKYPGIQSALFSIGAMLHSNDPDKIIEHSDILKYWIDEMEDHIYFNPVELEGFVIPDSNSLEHNPRAIARICEVKAAKLLKKAKKNAFEPADYFKEELTLKFLNVLSDYFFIRAIKNGGEKLIWLGAGNIKAV